MACRLASWGPISAARSGTAAVDRAIDSPLVVTAVSARLWLRLWATSVTRCAASMEGRAATAGGVRTAHGVPLSVMGSDQRSSVGHSRGGSYERSTRRSWSLRSARLWLRLCATRVALLRERVLSAPELRSGPLTARPVPTNRTGRQLLSSIAVSNAPSIEHAAHRGARPWLTAPGGDECHALARASAECS